MPIDPEFLAILACPVCKGPLTLTASQDGLYCAACQLVFPIEDDIPILLPERGVPTADWKGSAVKAD